MAEKITLAGTVQYCDCCETVRGLSHKDSIIKGVTLYDAPCQSSMGSWMYFCRNCYNTYAFKGLGTQFRKNENGVWEKVKSLIKKTKSESEIEALARAYFGDDILGY